MSTNNWANRLLIKTKVVLAGLCHLLSVVKEHLLEIREALEMSVYFMNNLYKLSHRESSLLVNNYKTMVKLRTKEHLVLTLKVKQLKLSIKDNQTNRILLKEAKIRIILLLQGHLKPNKEFFQTITHRSLVFYLAQGL